MAYTSYPSEASNFYGKSESIKTELVENASELAELYSIFHVDANEDYLTLKTIEANEKIINFIAEGLNALDNDTTRVINKANELENKEAMRQKALKEKQEESEENN